MSEINPSPFMKPILPVPSTTRRKLSTGFSLGDAHFSLEQSGHTAEDHLHAHDVFFVADRVEAFAAGHAAREHLRVLKQFIGALAHGGQRGVARDFHDALESAASMARAA